MEKGGRGGQTKEGNKEREGEESSTYYPLQLIGPDFRSTEMGILNRRTSIRNSYSTQCRFRNPENSESTHDIYIYIALMMSFRKCYHFPFNNVSVNPFICTVNFNTSALAQKFWLFLSHADNNHLIFKNFCRKKKKRIRICIKVHIQVELILANTANVWILRLIVMHEFMHNRKQSATMWI